MIHTICVMLLWVHFVNDAVYDSILNDRKIFCCKLFESDIDKLTVIEVNG